MPQSLFSDFLIFFSWSLTLNRFKLNKLWHIINFFAHSCQQVGLSICQPCNLVKNEICQNSTCDTSFEAHYSTVIETFGFWGLSSRMNRPALGISPRTYTHMFISKSKKKVSRIFSTTQFLLNSKFLRHSLLVLQTTSVWVWYLSQLWQDVIILAWVTLT